MIRLVPPWLDIWRFLHFLAISERAMCARPLALRRSIQATYMDALTKYDYMRTPAQTATLDLTQRP